MNLISRRAELLPWLLAAAGLILRLEYLREYSALVNFDVPVGPDVMEYDLRAREFLNGRLFPSSPDIHAPLYPLLLAFLYRISDFSLPFIRLFQLLLNYGAWLWLERLLCRKGFPYKLRMVFLGITMLYPVIIFHQAELISESILLPCTVLILWFLELADTEFDTVKRLIRMTAAGAASGAAALIHPLTLSFAAAEFTGELFHKRRKEAAVFLAGAALVILPVAGIKTLHYGKLTGIQQNGAFNIWLGNNPDATGGCYMRPGPGWRTLHADAEKEAAERGISVDRVWFERCVKFWIGSPVRGVMLYLKKAVLVWSPAELIAGADPGAMLYRTPVIRYGSFMLPLLLFFAFTGAGFALVKKERGAYHFFLLAAAVYISQILTVTSGRYRLAMFPALLFFSAYGAVQFNWKKYFYLPFASLAVCVPVLLLSFGHDRHEAAALTGEAALKKGKSGEALVLLDFAKQGCFDPARISNLTGMIHENSRNFAGAEKDYLEAAKGDPDSMESFMNLGNLYGRFPAKHKQAEICFRHALKLAPESAVLHYNYALFLKNTGRKKAAGEELLLALKYNDRYSPAYNILGILALESGNREAALQCFRSAVENDPGNSGYRSNLEFVRNGIRSAPGK